MASIEEKLMIAKLAEEARINADKNKPSLPTSEIKEEFLGGKALQPEASDKVVKEASIEVEEKKVKAKRA